MPTPEQIERARVVVQDLIDDAECDGRYIVRAALLAAAPTPEEHERALENAIDAFDNVYEGQLEISSARWTDNEKEAMDQALRAYIAATWGADG